MEQWDLLALAKTSREFSNIRCTWILSPIASARSSDRLTKHVFDEFVLTQADLTRFISILYFRGKFLDYISAAAIFSWCLNRGLALTKKTAAHEPPARSRGRQGEKAFSIRPARSWACERRSYRCLFQEFSYLGQLGSSTKKRRMKNKKRALLAVLCATLH